MRFITGTVYIFNIHVYTYIQIIYVYFPKILIKT